MSTTPRTCHGCSTGTRCSTKTSRCGTWGTWKIFMPCFMARRVSTRTCRRGTSHRRRSGRAMTNQRGPNTCSTTPPASTRTCAVGGTNSTRTSSSKTCSTALDATTYRTRTCQIPTRRPCALPVPTIPHKLRPPCRPLPRIPALAPPHRQPQVHP